MMMRDDLDLKEEQMLKQIESPKGVFIEDWSLAAGGREEIVVSERPNIPGLNENIHDTRFAWQVRDPEGYVWIAMVDDADASLCWERTRQVSDSEWGAFMPAICAADAVQTL